MASNVSFSGIASGIDTESLISATLESMRSTKVNPKQEKVTELQSENAALDELKTMIQTFKDTVSKFSTLNGGVVEQSAVSTDESILSGTASKNASNGSYFVQVNQLARNASYSLISEGKYTSSNAPIASSLAGSETFSMEIGDPDVLKTVNVSIDSSTTLSDFVMNFNSQAQGYATAAVVNRGTESDPDYIVMVSCNSSGAEKGIKSVTIPTALTSAGVWTPTKCVEIKGRNAELSVNGVAISRPSNTISDIINGLTLNLSSEGTATISVENDIDKTTTNIQDFVDAYNDIVKYITENNEVTRDDSGSELTNVYGSLAKVSIDNDFLNNIKANMSQAKNTSGTAVAIFADLGIKTNRDGTLEFKTDDLEKALTNDASGVNTVVTSFADTAAMTGGTIDQYVRYNGLIDVSINSNETQIKDLNERISRAETQIAQREASLRAQYANFETLMGKLQSQSSSITSILAGMTAK